MDGIDSEIAVQLSKLEFSWPGQNHATLKIADLTIKRGEHLFIQGASGSGKSTLLNLISGVLLPTKGKVQVLGQNLQALSQARRDRFRADHLGIVFQQFNLLPYLSAKENIELALSVSNKRQSQQDDLTIQTLLSNLGLNAEHAQQKACELSIGQQQRVAVARALIGQPELLIVDEPTSALDSDSCNLFMQQLFALANQAKSTIIFVSHDTKLHTYFSQVCQFETINQA